MLHRVGLLRCGEHIPRANQAFLPGFAWSRAGALALLQEAGEAGAVAAAGQQWLAAHRRSKAAPDVALATALALCDLARSSLEEHGGVAQVTYNVLL